MKLNKNLIKVFIFCFLYFGMTTLIFSNPYQDSTVFKIVKGMQRIIKERSSNDKIKVLFNDHIFINDSGFIHIDSLIGYEVSRIREIAIKLDCPEAICGVQAKYGVIVLYRKESD